MKNFTHLFLFSVLLIVTAPQFSHAQTLVNLARQYTTNQASLTYPFQTAIKISDSEMVVVGSVNSTTNSNFVFATKYNTVSGAVEWEDSGSIAYNSSTNYIEAITGACVAGPYLYISIAVNVQQFGNGLSLAASGIAVGKFSLDNGAEVWLNHYYLTYVIDSSVQLTDTSYIMPTSIVADGAQNVYIGGIQETGYTGSQLLVFKIDSNGNQLWSDTQSISVYSGAAAIAINPGDTTLTVTGFSGTAWNSWDFVTATVATDSGNITKASFSNYGPAFQSPAGLVEDYGGRPYIAGTIGAGGSGTAIEMIGYDTSLSQRFAKIWSNADSMHLDSAARMQQDANANILITGFTTAGNGAKQLLVLKYNTSGTLIFSRTIAAPNNPNYNCVGNDITADDSLNVYITGYFYNGITNNNDFITIAFDKNGNTLWEKTYDGGGTNDIANDIVVDNSGDIWVSGISSIDTSATYLTLEYQQLTLSSSAFTDTSGKPIYLTGQIIIKVDSSAVIRSAVDDDKIQFGSLSTYLNPWMVDSINAHLPTGTTCQLAKMFINLKTTDTISISRLGQRVPIPDFWSTFVLTFTYTPEMELTRSSPVTESLICRDLDKLFPLVQNTELDWLATLTSVITPNDFYYRDTLGNTNPLTQQFSLYPNITYPGSDINVPPAWEYTLGQPYIKTGVVDDGLLLIHPDFIGDDSAGYMPSVAKGGYDFINNFTLPDDATSDAGEGHGTMVGGVIGAARDNHNGIAGIAGGDSATPGVSLYGFRIFNIADGIETLASAHNLANGLVEIATQTPGNTYGWGMDIMNNSYQISSPNYSQQFADSGYYIDSNWSALIDAYHYVNRNQVVQPASSGNGSNDGENTTMIAPASFDSIWMFVTGGTSLTGEWEGLNWNGGTGPDIDQACIGAGMDIAAPYDFHLTYTTAIYNGTTPTGYTSFGGTSSAAAMVSGAVSLLCGYLNDTVPSYQNVTPEDAEYIIERSATIIDNTRYDTLTGWGRLNVGAALQMADTAQRKLHHFDSDSLSVTNTAGLLTSGIHIWLTERARNNNNTGQVFAPQGYNADIYKITCLMPLPFDSTDTLAAFWERPSSSYTYPYIRNDSSLIPHERIFIQSISPTSATVTGYIYHLYDTATNASIGWLPMDTAQAETANFAISVMVGDSIHVAVDTAITQIAKITTQYTQLSVFPNPATDNAVVQVASNCGGNVKLSMYDMQGIEIQSIFNGSLGNNIQSFPCSTSTLAAGMYFITMQSDCETKSLKFVKF